MYHSRSLSGAILLAIAVCLPTLPAAWATRADLWEYDSCGAIICKLDGQAPCCAWGGIVFCMQGRLVIAETKAPVDDGRAVGASGIGFVGFPSMGGMNKFFDVQSYANYIPAISVNDQAFAQPRRATYVYNGVLTIYHDTVNGIDYTREIFPSLDKQAIIQTFTIHNIGSSAITVQIGNQTRSVAQGTDAGQRAVVFEYSVAGIPRTSVAPGGSVSCAVLYTLRLSTEAAPSIDPVKERSAWSPIIAKARQSMALDVPNSQIMAAFLLSKIRTLQSPMHSSKGLINTTGSLRYFGGTWANDNVEYPTGIPGLLDDDSLTGSFRGTYQVYEDWSAAHPADRLPCSFEGWNLPSQSWQGDRGDGAMVLYGLSRFLLGLGDTSTALHFWPLIERTVSYNKTMTNAGTGVVGSSTDEMEGRLPTGSYNLATSSIAYGGYRSAAVLALAIGKPDRALTFDSLAERLSASIESYFGGMVQGYSTYRYYEGNTALRGWICYPLVMGLMQRRAGTIAALFSPSFWAEDTARRSISLMATAGGGGTWQRETMYALLAAFRAGATDTAIEKAIKVSRYEFLGSGGPYPDEDATDILPGSVLYARAIVEGLFGIEPAGFSSFNCTPRLPSAWPRMALRTVRLCGGYIDILVDRTGRDLRLTVSGGGTTLFQQSGPAGTMFNVAVGKAPGVTIPRGRPAGFASGAVSSGIAYRIDGRIVGAMAGGRVVSNQRIVHGAFIVTVANGMVAHKSVSLATRR